VAETATNPRIEQFRKMAADDPSNEIGHFSLGREYLNAGLYADAADSFRTALSINANLSKAYQLMATALLRLNRRDEAVERLTAGARKADERGDMLPRNEMANMLRELGEPVPEFATKKEAQAVGEGQVQCKRCGRVGPRLPKPPKLQKGDNQFGKDVYENVCADCWREAIGMGTKVINELRLPMHDPQAQKVWEQHIREFLNLGGAQTAE
jgi:Fe-S cluster biosynthesis and repair protein YggX